MPGCACAARNWLNAAILINRSHRLPTSLRMRRSSCARWAALSTAMSKKLVRVRSTCLVQYDSNRYSVPSEHAGHHVSLRAYADRLVVVANNEVIAEHARFLRAISAISSLGTMCPCWIASLALCVMARPLSVGNCPRRWSRSRITTCARKAATGSLSICCCWHLSMASTWSRWPAIWLSNSTPCACLRSSI
jgi:hypothetical protein